MATCLYNGQGKMECWKEVHAVVERSLYIGIQMRLPYPSVFIILIL